MESGGGVRIESHNLRDLLRIKEDDHCNNLNQSSSSSGGGGGDCSSSPGLTLLALLGEKIGPPPPADEPLRNVHSSRTLYDIIQEERVSRYGRGRSDGGRSWRQLRDKIRRRQAASISSWSSTVSIPETDAPFNHHHHHHNRTVLTRRHSDRFDPVTSSAESTQPSVTVSPPPDVSNPVSPRNPSGETEMATGTTERTQSPPLNTSVTERNEESAEHVDVNVAAAENAEEASEQPARTSLMALLAENDRQMGLKRSAYVMCAELKSAAETEETGGGEAAECNNCCVCMVRHKGAAFIPCGHTFCRLCSRELWVQRGNCPICNNFILEILDIF